MHKSEQFNLEAEYKLMWEQGKTSLRENGVSSQDLLPVENDKRQGLGLFFWQNELLPATQPFLETIHNHFPEEIVLYGFADSPAHQHVTLLELISTQDDYATTYQKYEDDFAKVCGKVLKNAKPIKAVFKGFVANPSCIIIKGYPEDNSFNEMREQLREAIEKAGLPPLNRRKVQIFHTTVGRFLKPIKDIEKLISVIDELNNVEIGEDTFRNLHLVRASWLMAETQTKTLANFRL